jgi:hypothetical protein
MTEGSKLRKQSTDTVAVSSAVFHAGGVALNAYGKHLRELLCQGNLACFEYLSV